MKGRLYQAWSSAPWGGDRHGRWQVAQVEIGRKVEGRQGSGRITYGIRRWYRIGIE